MGKRDRRIDAYIAKAAPFARPILTHLRDVVHAACPDVVETIKWGSPAFEYQGLLCSMAAFKAHATFGFWKGELIVDKAGRRVEDAMGQFGRITTVADLPAKKVLAGHVRKAMKLNEDGVKAPSRVKKAPRKPLPVPADLAAALKKNAKARATFAALSPSHQREYLEWILEAKRDETRAKRLATTLEWLAQGKARNWKYANC